MLLLFLINVIVLFVLLHRFFDIRNLLNPFVYFYLYQVAFLSMSIVISSQDVFKVNFGSDDMIFLIWFAMNTSFLGGVLCMGLFTMAGVNRGFSIDDEIIGIDRLAMQICGFLMVFLAFLLTGFFFYKTGFSAYLSGDVEFSRVEAKKGYGAVVLLAENLAIMGSSLYLVSSKKIKTSWVILLFISIFVVGFFGSRAPILKIILVSYILYYSLRNRFPSILRLMSVGVFLFIILIAIGSLRKGVGEDFFEIFVARFFWRPFVTAYNLDMILESFREPIYGQGLLIELKTLLPGYSPNFGTWVKEELGLEFDGGSVTSSFIGIGHINYGVFGALIYPFFYGFLLNLLYFFMKSWAVTRPRLVVIAIISISYGGSSIAGIFAPTIYHVLPVIIFFIAYKTLFSLIKLIIKSSNAIKYDPRRST